MNSSRNSHQRHNFLRAEASRDTLKFRVWEMAFPGLFKRYFPLWMPPLFHQNTSKTENNVVEMSQPFHDIAPFEPFSDPSLFKYAFKVIQNWETGALQFYSTVLNFCKQLCIVHVEGDKSSPLRMA